MPIDRTDRRNVHCGILSRPPENDKYRLSDKQAKEGLRNAKNEGRTDRLELSEEIRKALSDYSGRKKAELYDSIQEIEEAKPYDLDRSLSPEAVKIYNENVDKINRLTGGNRPHIGEDNSAEDSVDCAEAELKTAENISEDDEEAEETSETESESVGKAVGVNAGKRARMIAAASNQSEVQTVMQLLQQDLAECKEGLENGWCDESEVAKVEALIEMANKRMSEVAGSEDEEETGGIDAFQLSMLY